MSEIRLNKIDISGNRVSYDYSASNDLKKYFNFSQPFFIEYDEDISMVPEAILVIPFLTNVLPVSWITGSDISVTSVDRVFYESIPRFRQGLSDMYRNVEFSGTLTADNIEDCHYEPSDNSVAFFSGGVDSYCTLTRNIERKPDLMTLWGSDISHNDTEGWNRVKNAVLETADTYVLKTVFVKTAFTMFLNYKALDCDFFSLLHKGWWGGVQHGLGITGHAAPYAWKHRASVVYIAATLSSVDKAVQWGSYPTIEGEVKFGSCAVSHDSFDLTRQGKIDEITSYHKKTNIPVKLRVCWESPGGGNCCNCEKCYRTIMGILVSGSDPNDYNLHFDINPDSLKKIKTLVVWGPKNYISDRYWTPIKQAAIKNKKQLEKSGLWKDIKWLADIDFSDIENNRYRKRQQAVFSIKNAFKRMIPSKILKKLNP